MLFSPDSLTSLPLKSGNSSVAEGRRHTRFTGSSHQRKDARVGQAGTACEYLVVRMFSRVRRMHGQSQPVTPLIPAPARAPRWRAVAATRLASSRIAPGRWPRAYSLSDVRFVRKAVITQRNSGDDFSDSLRRSSCRGLCSSRLGFKDGWTLVVISPPSHLSTLSLSCQNEKRRHRLQRRLLRPCCMWLQWSRRASSSTLFVF